MFSILCSGSTFTLSIYTVTSKSAVLNWNSYPGSSSYRITAFLLNSPQPYTFSSFSQNTIMGSINSLTPNTAYTFQVEALDASMTVLAQASVGGSTGMSSKKKMGYRYIHKIIYLKTFLTYIYCLFVEFNTPSET